MAQRSLDTEFFNTAFVRALPGPYKFLWGWLQLNCNHAGIWEIDIDNARMRTGFYDLEISEAERLFLPKILVLSCGEKWFLKDFVESQQKTNELNPQNTYHWGVIVILQKLGLMENDFIVKTEQLKEPVKPLYSSSKAAKLYNIKYIDSKEEIIKEESSIKKEPKKPVLKKLAIEDIEIIPLEEMTEDQLQVEFKKAFTSFKEMRVKKKVPNTERAIMMIHAKLKELAGDGKILKIKILDQSNVSGWTGVFELKKDYVSSYKNKSTTLTDAAIFNG